ncbi:hypothetical protein QA601_14680 [Chitinispirillales bacterium ANBcel5]|uniref:hypothetical protein n=1 Tax=Cellulosispirillum alkaliphilum TaxID=3039283 RepID=UPI002A54E922|nr:hypothetical protein [Chitinispirillales bacterium ANBcel5]
MKSLYLVSVVSLLIFCSSTNPLSTTEDISHLESVVIIDNFENSYDKRPEQNYLSGLSYHLGDTLPTKDHGIWVIYHNDESSMFAPNGEQMNTGTQVSFGAENNFYRAVGPWGKEGNGLHLSMHLKGDNYPHIGVGTAFLGIYGRSWYDFSSLEKVTFWAKGSGSFYVSMTTDTIHNGYPPGDNWGNFAATITLSDEWTYYEIPVEDFVARPYSSARNDGLVWEDGKDKVTFFEFVSHQSYDKIANEELELFVDAIHFHGIEYSIFGINK